MVKDKELLQPCERCLHPRARHNGVCTGEDCLCKAFAEPNPDGLIDVTPLRPRCRECTRPLVPVGKYFECLNAEMFPMTSSASPFQECPRYQVLVTGGLPPLTVVSEKP